MSSAFQIVLKTEPLSEEYRPRDFFGRQAQLRDLVDAIELQRGARSMLVWLHGPAGSGKTSAAREIMGRYEQRQRRTAYVNCWSHQTFFSALEEVLQDVQASALVIRDVAFKFERLHRLAAKQPLLIVLDEVDQMLVQDRNASLYNFSRIPQVIIVCLTQSRQTYMNLDSRVQSRLRAQFIEFAAYDFDELLQILKDRAEASLVLESWCLADLERIASESNGDARVAIEALRVAAYRAERQSPRIRSQDITVGIQKGRELRRRYILNGLSEHHRLLYHVVAEATEIGIDAAWLKYRALSTAQKLAVMSRRSFDRYKLALITNYLIEERQRAGRRNERVLRVIA